MYKIPFAAHTIGKQFGGGFMFSSFLPGLVNGLLGTGGGILAVAVFQRQGLTANQSHATAVGLMLPLSAISLTILLFQYEQQFLCYWPLIIPTILGSVTGSWLLKRVKPQRLRLLFIALIIYSAIRILSS